MMIREMANYDRPREKAIRFGLETLTNQELLAVILRSGTKDESALVLAQNILNKCGGLNKLHLTTMSELMSIKGIKKAKALSIMCAIELAKRMQFTRSEDLVKVCNAKDVYNYLMPKMKFEQQEKFYVLFLNLQNEIIYEKLIFTGTLNVSVVHPREIFKEALGCSCAAIICVHNHPSGSLVPSNSDIALSKQLEQVGKTMQINLFDHIIISSNGFISLRSKGFF